MPWIRRLAEMAEAATKYALVFALISGVGSAALFVKGASGPTAQDKLPE